VVVPTAGHGRQRCRRAPKSTLARRQPANHEDLPQRDTPRGALMRRQIAKNERQDSVGAPKSSAANHSVRFQGLSNSAMTSLRLNLRLRRARPLSVLVTNLRLALESQGVPQRPVRTLPSA
jgi:hypothetical protein